MKKTIRTLRSIALHSIAVLLISLAAWTVPVLTGCSKTVNDVLETFGSAGSTGVNEEQDAVKLNKETRYYSDFLGVSFAVPKGWWLYEVDENNFSPSKGDTADEISLDMEYGDYEGYTYSLLWLMSFGNLENSGQDNHLGFHLDARALKGINNMAGYMKYFEIYMLEPTEDANYSLLESRQITIKGKPFEFRTYLVSQEENDFHYLTFTCEVKEGFFFNISVDYWPKNTKAEQAAIESITKAIEFY